MKPILPAPVRPLEPAYEDLASVPDQAHTWDENDWWEAGYHQGLRCTTCGESSECELCESIDADLNCLRNQAENRNLQRERTYKRTLQGWEAQMAYYSELKERYGYQ